MLTWDREFIYEKNIGEVVHEGLANSETSFFVVNDKCYIMDGANYLVFDGETVAEVTPYIPTFAISKNPDDGGTKYEDINLLGSGFKDNFSADGTSTVYTLSFKGLDATPLVAEVNGVVMNEGAGFTVDRVNGKVTFTSAPAKGTNNVIITAYKTYPGYADRIKKCRFHAIFGGSNDTRVFVSGNPTMPDYVWRLGLYDPTYAPENGFYKYPQKVKGFSKQYDSLLIHRERGMHQVTFELVNGEPSFPSKPINDQVGTLGINSIQIIENNPVWVSRHGVYMLTASNVRDERNVTHLSQNVDPKLLNEVDLPNAVSIDFDQKYWLAVNGNVYVYDYMIQEWFIYDNIHASCFLEKAGYLYFGSSKDGQVYRFMKDDEPTPYHDDGEVINAHWKSKYFTFGADEMNKLVEKAFFSLKPATKTSADLYYVTNKKESELVKTSRMDQLDFRLVDFNYFSFLASSFPQETMVKIKAKKVTHFQLIFENKKEDESMGILSAGIKYLYQNYVK